MTLTKARSYTEKHFSPHLIRSEMEIIQRADKSLLEDLTIKTSRNASEVTASYAIEDATLDVVIKLPPTFPLRQVDVESGTGGRSAGVAEARWRAWLLSASAVMVAQNGSILDALAVFHKNITLHFEGMLSETVFNRRCNLA